MTNNTEKLKALLKKGDPFMMKISPELAREILETMNTRNRTIRKAHSEKLAAAMGGGEWSPRSNDPLRFYSDLTLADGQHRLYAVAQSEVECEFLIAPDTAEDYRYVGDQGARRTSAEALKMDGHQNPSLLAKTATACFKWIYAGSPVASLQVSTKQLADFVERNQESLDKAVEFSLSVEQVPVTVKPEHMAALYWRYAREEVYPMDLVSNYLRETATGVFRSDHAEDAVSLKVRSIFEKSARRRPASLSTRNQAALLNEGLRLTLEGKVSSTFKAVKKVTDDAFSLAPPDSAEAAA